MAPVTRAQDQGPAKVAGNPKVTLYWLNQSRAQRILWLLEELQVPYELKTFKRQNMLAPAELKEVHPLGKAPIITVTSDATEEGKPLVIAESGPIIEYLIDHWGPQMQPTKWKEGKEGMVGGETEGWLRNRYLLHYAEGTLMPYLVTALLMNAIQANAPFFVRPLASLITGQVKSKYIEPNLATNFAFLEDLLKTSPDGGDFLCGGELTGADVVLVFPLGAARGRAGLTKEKYPKLYEYVAMLEERDAFKRAVQKIIEIEGSYDSNL